MLFSWQLIKFGRRENLYHPIDIQINNLDTKMKDIIFLANDPGGFDVIWPLYKRFTKNNRRGIRLLLTGSAGEKKNHFQQSPQNVVNIISSMIEKKIEFILVTGTSWDSNVEREAIRLCKNNQVVTVSILDYWCNYMERFQSDIGYIFPDYLFVMDEIAAMEAVDSGIDKSIIRIVGHPGLDFYVKKKTMWKAKNSILFLSQPLSLLYGDSMGYTELDAFKGVLTAGKELGFSVKIKFHPKESEHMRQKYGEYGIDGMLEDIVGDYGGVIGMSTMGLLQCSLMGIPIISYQPRLKVKDMCITNKLGITKGAYKYSELIDQLRVLSDVRNVKFPFWYDGKSTDRCTGQLNEIIGSL